MRRGVLGWGLTPHPVPLPQGERGRLGRAASTRHSPQAGRCLGGAGRGTRGRGGDGPAGPGWIERHAPESILTARRVPRDIPLTCRARLTGLVRITRRPPSAFLAPGHPRPTVPSPLVGEGQGEGATLGAAAEIGRRPHPCAGHPRLPARRKDVDGRDKPDHDAEVGACERAILFAIRDLPRRWAPPGRSGTLPPREGRVAVPRSGAVGWGGRFREDSARRESSHELRAVGLPLPRPSADPPHVGGGRVDTNRPLRADARAARTDARIEARP